MKIAVQVDARQAIKATAKLIERTPVVTAQELNRQATRSKTLITRELATVLGVKPQKRIRRRIILPRGGMAKPGRLTALGLSLVETMPGRYFAKGKRGRGGGITMALAGGSSLRNTRATTGQPFRAVMPNGFGGVFRRVDPPKTREGRNGRTWLPIQEVMVNTAVAGYAVRERTLETLAKEWPEVWNKRMKREIKRAFG